MALVIETGAGLPDADSFATVDELVQFASDYGWTIPSDTSAREAILRRAGVAMWAKEWVGAQLHDEQGLPWPRYYTVRRGFMADGSSLPRNIKLGQMALACEIHQDDTDKPEERKGAITREKVGPLETEFAEITGYKAKAVAGRQSDGFFAKYSLGPYNGRVVRG
ncbi:MULTISPECIES: DnaT-like ssDNA-binding protein [Pseudomonadaceae]|uniref:DnaT-like ssDNA-binding protein n=1 Tax=Pseudomonadaceae TaxID=135621 RepID=UPI001F2ACA39|nr:DnaT-like ssDNA-binding protein [Pseudomonas tohonis]